VLSFQSCQNSKLLSGSVFIVTEGRENIRLGLVTVAAIPASSMLVYLKSKCLEKDRQFVLHEELVPFIFGSLPSATIIAITDADGNFKLRLPNNEGFYIVARTSRKTLGVNEEYFWIQFVPRSHSEAEPILLSNHNLLTEEATRILLEQSRDGTLPTK
jgi:hypothetical protein